VNTIPWEKVATIARLQEELKLIEECCNTVLQLLNGPRARWNDVELAGLIKAKHPLLSKRLPGLLQGKFIGIKHTIDLKRPTGYSNNMAAVKAIFKHAIEFTSKLHARMSRRFFGDSVKLRKLQIMGNCLDLRMLHQTGGAVSDSDQRMSLQLLADWARSHHIPLPSNDVLWGQHQMLRQRLVECSTHGVYRTYFDARSKKTGIYLQKLVFTNRNFYDGCHDWLYLYSHMVMKSPNESVAESMGSILDQHADPQRGLSTVDFSKEAFIHWNGPAAHKAKQFLIFALEARFPGKDWRKEFSHQAHRQDRLSNWIVSQVVDNYLKESSKLPFME
jgi:hypothetical protein